MSLIFCAISKFRQYLEDHGYDTRQMGVADEESVLEDTSDKHASVDEKQVTA